MRAAALGLCLAATACAPQPRSESFFEAHPDQAARVVAACATGVHRGQECETASAALARVRDDERMKFYRRGF
jgi:hypothetical protein